MLDVQRVTRMLALARFLRRATQDALRLPAVRRSGNAK
jgi:hypothetical protein